MWIDFFETFVFEGVRYGRSLLYNYPDKSAQIYVGHISDVLNYIFDSMAGLCDLRRSINPRDGDINNVPYVDAIGLDIDAGDFELAKKEAQLVASLVEKLKGKPYVIFTGGKGYALVVKLKTPIEPSDEHYRYIVSQFVESLNLKFVDMGPGIKYAVRIPFTRHTKTGNLVLLYDYKSDRHIKTVHDAMQYIQSIEPVEISMPKIQRIKTTPTVVKTKKLPNWIYEVEQKCIPDCRKRFVIAVLIRALCISKTPRDQIIERVKSFLDRCGSKAYTSWIRSVVNGVCEKKLRPYTCEEFFGGNKTFSCDKKLMECT